MKVRLCLLQLRSIPGRKEINIEKAIEVIKSDKVEEEVDLNIYILPELYVQGYLSKDLHFILAETIPGPTTELFAEVLKEKSVKSIAILGMSERSSEDRLLYNSAAIVGERGVIGVYRKRHLPSYGLFEELRYFNPWRGTINVYNIDGLKLGVAICYDAFFPEVSRTLMLRGAILHVYLSAAPDMSRDHFETFIKCRAMENTVFVAYVNNVGFQDGIGFFGGSHVRGPLGKMLVKAKLYEEDVVSAVIDTDRIRSAREKRPIIRDLIFQDVKDLYDAYLARS